MNFPLTFGLERIGLPLIITSNNIIFLVDTGSTGNIIFDFVYEHFKDEFQPSEETFRVMGIEGNYVENPMVKATFNFDGKDYSSTFAVLNATDAVKNILAESGIQIHGILGIDFLVENGWVIDLKNLEIRCDDSV